MNTDLDKVVSAASYFLGKEKEDYRVFQEAVHAMADKAAYQISLAREEGARASVEWIRESVGFENIGLDEASIYQVSEDDLKEALTAYKKNV